MAELRSWLNFVGGGRRQLFARNLELFLFRLARPSYPLSPWTCAYGGVTEMEKKNLNSNEASGFGLEVKNWKKWKRHFGKIRETSFLPFYL